MSSQNLLFARLAGAWTASTHRVDGEYEFEMPPVYVTDANRGDDVHGITNLLLRTVESVWKEYERVVGKPYHSSPQQMFDFVHVQYENLRYPSPLSNGVAHIRFVARCRIDFLWLQALTAYFDGGLQRQIEIIFPGDHRYRNIHRYVQRKEFPEYDHIVITDPQPLSNVTYATLDMIESLKNVPSALYLYHFGPYKLGFEHSFWLQENEVSDFEFYTILQNGKMKQAIEFKNADDAFHFKLAFG